MESCENEEKLISLRKQKYGLVVKGLSRLPVTEEIAGSNPVEPAKFATNTPTKGVFFISKNYPMRTAS